MVRVDLEGLPATDPGASAPDLGGPGRVHGAGPFSRLSPSGLADADARGSGIHRDAAGRPATQSAACPARPNLPVIRRARRRPPNRPEPLPRPVARRLA